MLLFCVTLFFMNFLILPRFSFILGRIALIFQNPLFFTSFFRNFALEKLENDETLQRQRTF